MRNCIKKGREFYPPVSVEVLMFNSCWVYYLLYPTKCNIGGFISGPGSHFYFMVFFLSL